MHATTLSLAFESFEYMRIAPTECRMSRGSSMNAHCLRFIRFRTTPLFLDYLSYGPSVRAMYPRSPTFPIG